MFGFLKKLFGFDEKSYKDAGVQIEQAPYKVEPAKKENDDVGAPEWLKDNDPATKGPYSGPPAVVSKVDAVNAQPIMKFEPKPAAPVIMPPAAMTAKKKLQGQKKPQGQKPAQKPADKPATSKPASRRGRKPKAS